MSFEKKNGEVIYDVILFIKYRRMEPAIIIIRHFTLLSLIAILQMGCAGKSARKADPKLNVENVVQARFDTFVPVNSAVNNQKANDTICKDINNDVDAIRLLSTINLPYFIQQK